MPGFLHWAAEHRWVPRGRGGWSCGPHPRAAGVQGCWCPGLAAERSEAGSAPRQVQLVHCSTQPAAALGELLSSSPLTDAPGHPSPFAILCQGGFIQLTTYSGKGVMDGPWPLTSTLAGHYASGGAALKAPECPAHSLLGYSMEEPSSAHQKSL